ncbi:MAG: outer membrane protein assembly factor [Longimicrobiales bacterium]
MSGAQPATSRIWSRKAAADAAAFLSVGLGASVGLLSAGLLSVGLVLLAVSPAAGQQLPGGPGAAQEEIAIDSIAVEGNVRLSRSQILGSTTLRTGNPMAVQDARLAIQRAVKDLWDTGQFQDVQVYASGGGPDGEPVVLTYRVDERPLIRSVEIRGLENVSPANVRDTSGLETNQPYSPTRVETAKRFIREELADRGIPFARIDEHQEPIPDAEKEIRLVLDVTEGNRVTVAQVEIHGNDRFSDDQLIGALETRPEGFWWFRSGTYDEEEYRQDLAAEIPDFYRARGHLDVAVVDDTLVVDPQTGKARIELTVEEGPQYRVAEFMVEGNERFSTDQLQGYFREEGGGLLQSLGFGGEERGREPVFDQVRFQEATEEVSTLYRNSGYLYAQVRPFIEPLDGTGTDGQEGAAQGGADAGSRSPGSEDDDPRVRIGWEIDEGDPAYVDRVAIVGNDHTHERVIRDRILLLPGDVYSEERLLQSYQSIQALGFFSSPLPLPDIQPDPETGDVDITFEVEEQQTGSLSFGTSVGGGTGLSGFLGYDEPNLFGQAKETSLRWDFGRYINSFTASFTDPALFGSRTSGSISLFNARDRFFTFRSGERRRLGVTTRFGIPVPGSRFTRLFAGYGISRTDYRLREGAEDTSLFGRAAGTQSSLSLGLTRSTLNHPLFPTQGSRQRINFDFNGGPLGGDGDFVKQTMEGQWWVPVGTLGGDELGTGGVRLALGLTMQAGAVYGDADNFPFDRFWMGGVQFGESLRGYDETTITPLGYFPEGLGPTRGGIPAIERLGDAYLRISAEYAMRLTDNISVSTFYDAGSVWRDPREVNPGRLSRGAGVGIQLVTPFGPLGLDYAYGFDKTEPGWQFHFRMGGQGGQGGQGGGF